MADEDDLLQQANRLMRRHSSFVPGAGSHPRPAPEGDDLPVLTDIVDSRPEQPSGITPPLTPEPLPVEPPVRRAVDCLPMQRQAMTAQLATWLDQELPQIVMRVLDGYTDQLVAQISLEARAKLLPRLRAALEEAANAPVNDSKDSRTRD